ncbi:hypothetical protein [Dyella sp. C11]|uniref:hypothetical protein n=1 Tax=Dyella sp. C11 TaxID=2126991 RepID=UPI000D646F1C|nr:hypothetical protein [Dyella sp. C11]
MNARAALAAPWYSTHAAMRWLAFGVLAVCVIAAVCLGIFSSKVHWAWAVVGLYSAGLFYLWAFYLSSITLLAVDAHWLCIPGLKRSATFAVIFYAVLSLMPTVLVALADGNDIAPMILVSSLAIAGGLSLALLPRYFAMFTGVVPVLFSGLSRTFHLPGVDDPRFTLLTGAILLALLVLCAWRWRTVIATAPQNQSGVSGALVLQYRRSQWSGWGGMNGLDSTAQARQRPDWMQPRADLRRVGPLYPSNSMRVALGGWYLPLTAMGRVRAVVPTLAAMTLPFLVMFLIFSQDHGLSPSFWYPFLALMGGWICLFGAMGMTFMTVMLMQQRWRKPNAELPLLALMPGLGDAASAKCHLLSTAIGRPLRLQVMALILLVGMMIATHAAGTTMLMIVVGQLGCIAALIVCVLGIVAGRPLPGWGTFALMIAISLLLGCTSFLPSSTVGKHPWVPATSFVVAVLGGWTLVAIAMAWIGRRGMAAWRKRPHVFMPNG